MYVSVSCYQDAGLLEGCLESVREQLPDATIDVVDGRYETWPAPNDNSTDATSTVASKYGARYVAGGPYERESDKHEHRVELAPDGERALFLDADERLLHVDVAALEEGTAYQPRIFNALVYGPVAVYWPRSFYPETVENINRWDAYLFDAPVDRTNAITIVHRHDLRDQEYRRSKYERFENEDRTGRYDDSFEQYLENEFLVDAQVTECPECGAMSVTHSQVTAPGDEPLTKAEACVAGDGCHAAIAEYPIHEYKFLPDDVDAGFEEDPARLRAELLDAGCSFIDSLSVEQFQRYEVSVRDWVAEEYGVTA